MSTEQQNKEDASRRQKDIEDRYEWEIASGHRDPITRLIIDKNRPVAKPPAL